MHARLKIEKRERRGKRKADPPTDRCMALPKTERPEVMAAKKPPLLFSSLLGPLISQNPNSIFPTDHKCYEKLRRLLQQVFTEMNPREKYKHIQRQNWRLRFNLFHAPPMARAFFLFFFLLLSLVLLFSILEFKCVRIVVF